MCNTHKRLQLTYNVTHKYQYQGDKLNTLCNMVVMKLEIRTRYTYIDR